MRSAVILVLTLLALACTSVRNVPPPPLTIPASLSEDEVEFAILLALKDPPKKQYSTDGMQMADEILRYALGRGYTKKKYWSYEGRAEDIIYAAFNYRNFYMRAEIKYTPDEVSLKIVDSRGLDQVGDKIHRKAPVWLGYLERDIRATLGAFDRVKYEAELLNNRKKSDRPVY